MDTTRVLSVFVEVARARSFTRAAHQMGLATGIVSRSVSQLETHLGARLFHRTTRRVNLTDEGQRLLELAGAGLQLLDEAMDKAVYEKQRAGGTIRVVAPRSLGAALVVPLVAAFQERHPDVRFEVSLEDQPTDLAARRIDVAFRSGVQPEGNVIVRPLCPMSLSICAAPAYVERFGTPSSEEDLPRFRCTGFRHPKTGRAVPWELRIAGESTLSEVPAVAVFNDAEAEASAVRSGIGIGQLPDYLVGADVANGQLVRLFPALTSSRFGVFMHYAQRTNLPVRVRQFIDFAVERAFAGQAAHRVQRGITDAKRRHLAIA